VELRNRFIPDEETAQLFLDADVVVLPYIEASQSGVIAISREFGLPVVATGVGGLPEAVRDGETGLIVPTRDPAALAQAILRLAREEPLRRRLGAAAQRYGTREFGRAATGRRVSRVYEQVLRNRASKLAVARGYF
jgi:glycosyltransferase involved in cell wall biosynthesis